MLVGACAGEGQSDRQSARERADTDLAAHPDLDPKVAGAIREPDLVEDMTPEQVTAARGKLNIVEKSGNCRRR